MFDVTALGELLIDFTFEKKSKAGMRLFEQNPGGAPCNVLTALQRCGLHTAFIGKVGSDVHGKFLKDTLEKQDICLDGMIVDDSVFTTLAFVEISEGGERRFSFARSPGADMMLRTEEVSADILKNSRIFHVGSLSLTDEPARSATLFALKKAKEFGCIISYDPNYRSALWKSREDAIAGMKMILPYVDIMKLSDEETELLTGVSDPCKAASRLVNQGIPLVAVTLGAKGAVVCTEKGERMVQGFCSHVVDTTGAGDSFWGGFLYCFVRTCKMPREVTLEEAVYFTRFANAMASLCVEKRGGMPAMPPLEAVRERLGE